MEPPELEHLVLEDPESEQLELEHLELEHLELEDPVLGFVRRKSPSDVG